MDARETVERMRGGPGRRLSETAARYVAPIFFAPEGATRDDAINNGTVFFIDCGGGPLAVTADHVFQEYVARKEAEPGLACRIGNLPFAPEERLVDRDGDRDIATFRVAEREVARLGNTVHRPDYDWPPARPEPGGGVFFAGFPGCARRPHGGRGVAFGIYAAATVATSVNDRVIVCQLDDASWIDTSGRGSLPDHAVLGGLSGAPLWIAARRRGAGWCLGGVIASFNQRWGLLYAKHAASIRADGTLAPPQFAGLDRTAPRPAV